MLCFMPYTEYQQGQKRPHQTFYLLCRAGGKNTIAKTILILYSSFFKSSSDLVSMLINSNCGNSAVSKYWLVILSRNDSVIMSSSKNCSMSGNTAKIFSSLIFSLCLM